MDASGVDPGSETPPPQPQSRTERAAIVQAIGALRARTPNRGCALIVIGAVISNAAMSRCLDMGIVRLMERDVGAATATATGRRSCGRPIRAPRPREFWDRRS